MRPRYKRTFSAGSLTRKTLLVRPDSPATYQLSIPLLEELLGRPSLGGSSSTWITQIAYVCASAPCDEADIPQLYSSPLFDTIRGFLEVGTVDGVHRAMLCLANIFDNIEPAGAARLFQHLAQSKIIKAAIDQFPSPCGLRDSLSIRCTLATIFCQISQDLTIAEAAALGLKANLDNVVNKIVAHFAAHAAVPGCVSLLSILDFAYESDEEIREQCFREGIPTILLRHAIQTEFHDSARACLALLAKFVEARPDESPVCPEFVTNVLESELECLDDLMPLIGQTWALCSEAICRAWLEYAFEVLGSSGAVHLPARMLCGSCICACVPRLSPGDRPPMSSVVPRLCEILQCPGSDTETLLEMILQYAPHSQTLDECDILGFLEAVNSLETADLTGLAHDGSENAAALLELLRALVESREDKEKSEKPSE
jgi:hypothetical protein